MCELTGKNKLSSSTVRESMQLHATAGRFLNLRNLTFHQFSLAVNTHQRTADMCCCLSALKNASHIEDTKNGFSDRHIFRYLIKVIWATALTFTAETFCNYSGNSKMSRPFCLPCLLCTKQKGHNSSSLYKKYKLI